MPTVIDEIKRFAAKYEQRLYKHQSNVVLQLLDNVTCLAVAETVTV